VCRPRESTHVFEKWRHRERAVVLILTILFAGCQRSSYTGDGTLIEDRLSPSRRFVLDLGSVDLSKSSSTTFRIEGLPSTAFTLGFEIVPRPPRQGSSVFGVRPISVPVRVTLVDEHGQLVIDESGPVNDWVWSASPHESSAFVYRQGASRDVPTAGAVTSERIRIGEKFDHGWGSGFIPHPEGKYTLRVDVLGTDPVAAEYSVAIKGISNGWE